ncbi:MAG: hypothetical protein GY822_16210 [Deltaproteobacteria bacterium]|nr:hypothetical protein [Deltaproteobacteria bacterium]
MSATSSQGFFGPYFFDVRQRFAKILALASSISFMTLVAIGLVLVLAAAPSAQAKRRRGKEKTQEKIYEMAVVVDESLQKYLPALQERLKKETQKDLLSISKTQEELEAATFMGLLCEKELASDVKCHARLAILLRSLSILRLRIQKRDGAKVLVADVFSSSEGEVQHMEHPVGDDLPQALTFVVRTLFAPTLLRGRIRIAAFPATYTGATLVIDDELIGPLPLARQLSYFSLGTHRIQVMRGRKVLFSQDVLVTMDEQFFLSIPEPGSGSGSGIGSGSGSETANWIPGVAVLGVGGASMMAGGALASWGQLELDRNTGSFEERGFVQNVGRVGLVIVVVGIGAILTGGTLLGLEMVD